MEHHARDVIAACNELEMAELSKRGSAFVISPSIMRGVENLLSSNDSRFDLGMSEYTD